LKPEALLHRKVVSASTLRSTLIFCILALSILITCSLLLIGSPSSLRKFQKNWPSIRLLARLITISKASISTSEVEALLDNEDE
ncbi:hypothetical protein F5879DRAFT_1014633, partial [Lentinula edodes]